MRRILAMVMLLASALATAPAGAAGIYKCTEKGQVVYQDFPCAQGGTRIAEPPAAEPADAAATAEATERMRELGATAEQDRRLREIDAAIRAGKSALQGLETEHARELEALDQKKRTLRGDVTADRLDTIAREAKIDRERAAAVKRHEGRIKIENDRIARLEKVRERLLE